MQKPASTAVIMAGIAFLVTVCATNAYSAGARNSANVSVRILQPVTVMNLSNLSFGRFQSREGGTVTVTPSATRSASGVKLIGGAEFYPASYSIAGEPGRVYRVILPNTVTSSPGGLHVSDFTIWSANSGALLTAGIGQLDGTGGDALNIGATVTVPPDVRPAHFTATFPITIDYE